MVEESCVISRNLSILTVGDGDLSASLALIKAYNPQYLVATTLLSSESELLKVYPHAQQIILDLKSCVDSCTIMYGVDATQLHRHSNLMYHQFDLILFQHPHLGYSNLNNTDSSKTHTQLHSQLLAHYLYSAEKLLCQNNPDACVHLCLCGESYLKWQLTESVERLGLEYHGIGSASKCLLSSYLNSNIMNGRIEHQKMRRKGHWLGRYGYRHCPTFPSDTKFDTNISASTHYFMKRKKSLAKEVEAYPKDTWICGICALHCNSEKELTDHILAPALQNSKNKRNY